MSRDGDRDRALVSMLGEGGSLASCDSVIVYCTRREECERLATHIRCGGALFMRVDDSRTGERGLNWI